MLRFFPSLSRCSCLLLVGIGALIGWHCQPKDTGQPHANTPQVVRLADITIADTLSYPRLKLYWIGDDPDGYVVGYRYRLTGYSPQVLLNIMVSDFALMAVTQNPKIVPSVYRYFANLPSDGLQYYNEAQFDSLVAGDSIIVEGVPVFASNSDSIRIPGVTPITREKNPDSVHTNPNSGSFKLQGGTTDNPYILNTFQIAAIDNDGDTSTVLATKQVYTTKVDPPVVGIVSSPSDTSFVLIDVTDIFYGIEFKYKAYDRQSKTIDYSWIVDKDQWPRDSVVAKLSRYTPNEEAYVTARDFPDPYATVHTFSVQARNEFGEIDSVGPLIGETSAPDTAWATVTFHTLYPSFKRADIGYNKQILILNASYDDPRATSIFPSVSMIDTFYRSILQGIGKDSETIHFFDATNESFPGHLELSKYSLIVYVGDGIDQSAWQNGAQLTSSREKILTEYTSMGGNLIFSGWYLAYWTNMITSGAENWFANVLHTDFDRKWIAASTGFSGANGKLDYPDLRLDSTKIMDTLWNTGLKNILLAYPVGFGESIYKEYSVLSSAANQSCGVRYITHIAGNDPMDEKYFNVVYFSFPLYYMQHPNVDSAMSKALQDIGQ